MRKTKQNRDLRGQSTLLALTLAVSLAAFGCTTNMNPGSGTPTRVTPELRSAPSTVPIGTENTAPLPPPMMSSYTQSPETKQTVTTPRSIRHTADEAAAIMAGIAPLRGRYLGPANPGPSTAPNASNPNAAIYARPPYEGSRFTVNSELGANQIAGVSSGAGGVSDGTAAIISSAVAAPVTATTAATGTAATPTATDSIAANPTITAASTAAPTTPTTATTTTTVTAASSTPVRIERSSTGTVTVTNASTGSRNQ